MDRFRISPSMVVGISKVRWSDRLCSLCKFLPHDAVWISCGHWLCLECAQQILTRSLTEKCRCPEVECGERLLDHVGPPFASDVFLRSEYERLQVMCFNNSSGCAWVGKVRELQVHFKFCQYGKVKCRYCPQWTDPAQQNDHLQSCQRRYPAGDDFTQGVVLVSSALEEMSLYLDGTQKMRSAETRAVQSISFATLHKRLIVLGDGQQRTQEAQRVLKKAPKHFDGSPRDLKETAVCMEANQDAREFRFSQYYQSTGEAGSMIWAVSHFFRRLEDARSGKRTSIMSPPFYTSCYGYKMRLRLYPAWSKNHVALFVVLIKGEYDDTLQWPFPYKITLKLLNQGSGEDVARTIVPSPRSSSFQKPTADSMNLSAGFPQFVAIQRLETEGLAKHDTLLCHAYVDTNNQS